MSLHIATQNLIDYILSTPAYLTLRDAEAQLEQQAEASDVLARYRQVIQEINELHAKGQESKSLKQSAVQLKMERDQLPAVRSYIVAYQAMRLILDELNQSLFEEFTSLHEGRACVTRPL